MRVIKLEIKNALGIKAFFAENLDHVVKLLGKNGAGKSRVITCLLAALKYDSLPKDKRAELLKSEGAEISVEIADGETVKAGDGWRIRRDISNGKTRLHVSNEEGLHGNQSTLDKFIGDNFIDIGKFLGMPIEKKANLILDMVGLTAELDSLDVHYTSIYDERREIGRRRDAIGLDKTAPEKVEIVSVSDLTVEYEKATEHNRDIEQVTEQTETMKLRLREIQDEMSDLEKERNEIQPRLKSRLDHLSEMTPVDTNGIRRKMFESEEINLRAAVYSKWEEKKQEHDEFEADYETKTAKLDSLKKDKSNLIKNAEFPIAGLSYSDDGLTYNGHPLISDGEYRRIAFEIAKAMRGDLSIATFENFALLDPDMQEDVIREAKEAGFQIFVEIVTGGPDQDGFYIEDGALVQVGVDPAKPGTDSTVTEVNSKGDVYSFVDKK